MSLPPPQTETRTCACKRAHLHWSQRGNVPRWGTQRDAHTHAHRLLSSGKSKLHHQLQILMSFFMYAVLCGLPRMSIINLMTSCFGTLSFFTIQQGDAICTGSALVGPYRLAMTFEMRMSVGPLMKMLSHEKVKRRSPYTERRQQPLFNMTCL